MMDDGYGTSTISMMMTMTKMIRLTMITMTINVAMLSNLAKDGYGKRIRQRDDE